MKRQNIHFYLLIALLLVVSFSTVLSRIVYASTSNQINATVKISVCGNGIKEGGEDCDGNDFGGETCATVGYTIGTLLCDISCSYDTSECIYISPTPTPTTEPLPNEVTATPSNAINTNVISETLTPVLNTTSPSSQLPYLFSLLRIPVSDTIDIYDLYSVIKYWVDAWKESKSQVINQVTKTQTIHCDVNNDGVCNARDFSIVLYYIGK